ncbi:hypothetical protein I5I81_01735 [Pseudomonas aeruginosa]|nr:hypothetical protein [Pseudomonas aeruginosa]MBG6741529.1 hypothetical protein [Pseudomonas aeruginosa]MBG6858461.1 hypothetical protein [Pseudomonas aeruginosa]
MQTNDADRLAILRQIIDYSIENGESLADFKARAEAVLREPGQAAKRDLDIEQLLASIEANPGAFRKALSIHSPAQNEQRMIEYFERANREAPARRAEVERGAQQRLSQASSQESPEASSGAAGAAPHPSQPQASAKGGVVCQPANRPWPARLQAWLAGLRDQARRYVKGS